MKKEIVLQIDTLLWFGVAFLAVLWVVFFFGFRIATYRADWKACQKQCQTVGLATDAINPCHCVEGLK